jgi:WD40 repeat protein
LADGRLLSWSKYDKTLRLWSSAGEAQAVLRGHEWEVSGALALADGRLLSWSDDRTLRLWSSAGEEQAVLRGHEGDVNGALALADGRLLSWSWDKTLRLWSSAGEEQAVLRGHENAVNRALALVDGRLLSWSYDGTLWLWSSAGEAVDVLAQDYYRGDRAVIADWAKKHGLTLSDLYPPDAIDPITAGGRVQARGNVLVVYDAQTGQTRHTFYGDAKITAIAVLHEGRVVVAGDTQGRVLFLRVRG